MTKWAAALTNKYGAKRQTLDGYSFASKGEAECYGMLKLMEKAKDISDIRVQRTIQLTKHVRFKIDFVVFDEKLQKDVGVEFKGFEAERWRVIRNLWREFGPMPMRVFKKSGNRIFMAEEIRGIL